MSASSGARVELERVSTAARLGLERAAELAEARGERLAWVGGGVRDLFLRRDGLDLDLVLEGDLPSYGSELATRLGAAWSGPTRFLTGALRLPGGLRLDLVRARRERYAAPAALPEVEPAALAEDLARRDFTINAIAVGLAPLSEWGRLVDPLGGRADLEAGVLRAHHPRSFLDDPTRILRGLRFRLRFGFRWERDSRAWAAAAVEQGGVRALSGSRLARELRRLVDDRSALEEALAALGELGLASALSARLADAGGLERAVALAGALRRAAQGLGSVVPTTRWRLALLALAATLGTDAAVLLADRLALSVAERELALEGPPKAARARARLTPAALPHQVDDALSALSGEELALVASTGGAAAAWVARWLDELRSVRLRVGGGDLVAAGAAPGPPVGAALRATRAARLDGVIGPGEELGYALRRLRDGAPR